MQTEGETTPAPLPGLVGHERQFAHFRQATRRGRLASTYLLVGPEGIGKRRLAIGLAEALLCTASSPTELVACGACQSCRLAQSGTHPDLTMVHKPEGKSGLPIRLFIGEGDQRNRSGLCHDIALRPMLSARRVAIIDDADDFTIESANCLLKTLEEPPPRAILMLIGTSLAKQLPTIRSRSQVIRFASLTTDEVEAILVGLPAAEDHEPIGEEEAARLALTSRGSVSAALRARGEGAIAAREQILAMLRECPIDPVRLTHQIDQLTQEAGKEASEKRARMRELITVAIEHYHAELTGPNGSDTTLALLDACLEAEAVVARNANQSTLAQQWAVELGRRSRESLDAC